MDVNSPTALVRIRFPREFLTRLDKLTEQLSSATHQSVARAALIRVLLGDRMDAVADVSQLAALLRSDPVRRGRGKGGHHGRNSPDCGAPVDTASSA